MAAIASFKVSVNTFNFCVIMSCGVLGGSVVTWGTMMQGGGGAGVGALTPDRQILQLCLQLSIKNPVLHMLASSPGWHRLLESTQPAPEDRYLCLRPRTTEADVQNRSNRSSRLEGISPTNDANAHNVCNKDLCDADVADVVYGTIKAKHKLLLLIACYIEKNNSSLEWRQGRQVIYCGALWSALRSILAHFRAAFSSAWSSQGHSKAL